MGIMYVVYDNDVYVFSALFMKLSGGDMFGRLVRGKIVSSKKCRI